MIDIIKIRQSIKKNYKEGYEEIKAVRKEKNIKFNTKIFAEEIGVTIDSLRNLKRNNLNTLPNIELLIKISVPFNKSVDNILGLANTNIPTINLNKINCFDSVIFSKRLNAAINNKNISILELSKETGINRNTLTNYIDNKCKKPPKTKNLIVLALYFEINVEQLIF